MDSSPPISYKREALLLFVVFSSCFASFTHTQFKYFTKQSLLFTENRQFLQWFDDLRKYKFSKVVPVPLAFRAYLTALAWTPFCAYCSALAFCASLATLFVCANRSVHSPFKLIARCAHHLWTLLAALAFCA